MTTGAILPASALGRLDLTSLGPQGGQVIRALVMARLEDGLIRLAMPGGLPVNVRAGAEIQPGMTVEVAAQADESAPGQPMQLIVRGQAAPLAELPEPAAPLPPAPEAARAQVAAAAGQAAAQRQGGLGPLMADLAQAVQSPDTPPQVRAAAAQVLAARRPLDRAPTSGDIRQAFNQSGLFLESRLAASAAPAGGDMKAALLAVRQVLKAWQAAAVAPPAEETAAPAPAPAARAADGAVTRPAAPPLLNLAAQPKPAAALPQGPVIESPAAEGVLGQAAPASPRSVQTPVPQSPAAQPPSAQPLSAQPPQSSLAQPSLAQPTPPQALLASQPRGAAMLLTALEIFTAAAESAPEAAEPHAPSTANPAGPVPPPPYRGAPTAAQPQAAPTLPPHAEPAQILQRLLQETGGAIARQELLQLASMPEAATDARAADIPKAEQPQRWMFEIPFAAPQGAAVAQFEISRDGRKKGEGGNGQEAAEPVWRTRFSIDVEPMGPIHAQLALSGERVQVSLWAERESGLARLREQAPLLAQALNRAVAGPEGGAEVAIHPGAPHRPAAQAGRLVDVAS